MVSEDRQWTFDPTLGDALVKWMRANGVTRAKVAGMEVTLGPARPPTALSGVVMTRPVATTSAAPFCSCGHEEYEHDPLCLHGCTTECGKAATP